MYDAQETLQRISDHTVLVLALGAVALVCNYVFFGEAIRWSLRHRCPPFAPVACALWFAHDATYLLNFSKWFNDYDHWFPKLFWVGLIFTNLFEVVFIALTLRFGRDEMAPTMRVRDFRLWYVGALLLGIVFWAIGKASLSDPLYLITFLFTAVWALISGGSFALRRQSRRGQSVIQWLAFSGMCAAYGGCALLFFGGPFEDLPWIVLTAAGVIGGFGMAAWLRRLPAYQPDVSPVGDAVAVT